MGIVAMRRVATLAACAVVSGCATRLPAVAEGEPLAIVIESPSDRVRPVEVFDVAVVRRGRDGAAVGATLGALWGLACGPWALICMPLGAAVVGTGGFAMGAVTGAVQMTAEESRERLAIHVGALPPPREALLAALESRARGRWKLVPAPAANSLTVSLRSIAVQTAPGDMVELAVEAKVAVLRPDGASGAIVKDFEYRAPPTALRLWIENRDGFVAREFDRAYENIAESVMAELMP